MLIRALMLTSALVLAGPVIAQDNAAPAAAATPAAITDPAQFAATASASNMFEIQSSELALERAVSEDVRAFAQQMIADHTKAGDDMATAAGEEGVAPASELDQKHQEILNTLGGLEGEAFDAAYIQAQVQAHDEAVALFEGYAANGSEGPLKAFAAATLPTLQQHQAHVHEMAAM